MSDEKETVPEKKLPPFDQIPDPQPMPTLKRKAVRLDTDKPTDPTAPPIQPHLDIGEGDTEICAMPPGQVFTDLDLCNRGCAEFERQSKILNKRQEDIRVALKRNSQISFLLNKHQQRLSSLNPTNPRDSIKAFQQRTQERKMAAVNQTKDFLKGMNLKSLQKQLNPASQLDQSMQRQGGFGTKRPQAGPLHKPQAV